MSAVTRSVTRLSAAAKRRERASDVEGGRDEANHDPSAEDEGEHSLELTCSAFAVDIHPSGKDGRLQQSGQRPKMRSYMRTEVQWTKGAAKRLGTRDGMRESAVGVVRHRRRKNALPELTWASSARGSTWITSTSATQSGGDHRPARIPGMPPRRRRKIVRDLVVLAVAATTAVAGHPSYAHTVLENVLGECDCRIGEAANPGPVGGFDDPEADDAMEQLEQYLEEQSADPLVPEDYDGITASGLAFTEAQVEEGVGGEFDLGVSELARQPERTEDGEARARQWWNARLGDELDDYEDDGIDELDDERLLRDAFRQSGDGRHERAAGHDQEGAFMERHGLIVDEPDIREQLGIVEGGRTHVLAANAAGSGGVRLPEGLFQTLAMHDQADIEQKGLKWRRLSEARMEARAEVAARRGAQRRARSEAAGRVLQAEHLPNMPMLEEEEADEPCEGNLAMNGVEAADGARAVRCQGGAEQGAEGARGQRTHSRRARGRRQRGGQQGEIWTINSSGKPQLESTLKLAAGSKGKCVALLCQEHQQPLARVPDLQAAARKHGWIVAATPAAKGEGGGASAGTAILTPSNLASGLIEGMKVDVSPKGSEGRLSRLWLQRVVNAGIMLLSCYLHMCEGPSPRNMRLLSAGLCAGATCGCPWIMAGDFQDGPDAFLTWAGLLIQRAGAKVVATTEPTHYPGTGEPKAMDFFIVSERLAPYVKGVRVVSEAPAAPHRVVALTFERVGPPPLHWQRRAPRAFPREPPVGCARAPIAPAESEVGHGCGHGGRGTADESATAAERADVVRGAWGAIIHSVEAELCGRTDRYRGELPDQRWCGRAEGPRYARGPAHPPRAAGKYGDLDCKTHAMAWALNRFSELAALAEAAKASIRARNNEISGEDIGGVQGMRLEGNRLKQWYRVLTKVRSVNSPISKCLDEENWRQALRELAKFSGEPARAVDFLRTTEEWIRCKLQAHKMAHHKAMLRIWRGWVSKQLRNGAAGIFKFAKRTVEEPEILIRLKNVTTGDAQDLVEHDFSEWSALWNRLRPFAAAPWRGKQDDVDSEHVPAPCPGELRQASFSFKPWTGTSNEVLSPRHYGWLSDVLLLRIGQFIVLLERMGCWPEQLMEALVHLIPKPTGGRRPIGLLASLVRLWERVRRPHIQEWRAKVQRSYNWMTRGRGSARAVWAQTVLEEAARQRGLASAAVLVDLVKAFELIILARVWKVGVESGFPRASLRLSLEVCSFSRRLVYRAAHSAASCCTLTAVLAGSGYATDFVFLMIMEAVDNLIESNSGIHVCVIADDVKLGLMGKEGEVAEGIGSAAADFVRVLEDDLRMEVSRSVKGKRGKTVALVSSSALGRRLGRKMSRLGIEILRQTRNLGVDYRLGGGQVRRTVQKARWTKVASRTTRARRMGRRAAAAVAVGCDVPSVAYGASAAGISDGMLTALRRNVAMSFGPLQGRSTSVRLLMDSCDPGLTIVVGAVCDWVKAWWDHMLDRKVMEDALRHAQKTVGISARPNAAVVGGAGSYIAALRRLGWGGTKSGH